MIDLRPEIGAAGERLAAEYLQRNGVRIERRNVGVGRGEIDLIASTVRTRFLVEVRSRISEHAPIEAFDHAKRQQLRRLSHQIGVGRVDLVAVGFGDRFVTIHWIPSVL
jgi:Holliday junction resolvase-like predicted endonuclease